MYRKILLFCRTSVTPDELLFERDWTSELKSVIFCWVGFLSCKGSYPDLWISELILCTPGLKKVMLLS